MRMVFDPDLEMRAKPAWGRGGKVALSVGTGAGKAYPLCPSPRPPAHQPRDLNCCSGVVLGLARDCCAAAAPFARVERSPQGPCRHWRDPGMGASPSSARPPPPRTLAPERHQVARRESELEAPGHMGPPRRGPSVTTRRRAGGCTAVRALSPGGAAARAIYLRLPSLKTLLSKLAVTPR